MFPRQPQDVKKRIESLIDREYLARDPKAATYLIPPTASIAYGLTAVADTKAAASFKIACRD
jgi:hypothetical protein|eukprot:COSAG01_NODE_3871_length_5604_cov_15.632334_2_plen_62_part_00